MIPGGAFVIVTAVVRVLSHQLLGIFLNGGKEKIKRKY
jgi:hypothetical protein